MGRHALKHSAASFVKPWPPRSSTELSRRRFLTCRIMDFGLDRRKCCADFAGESSATNRDASYRAQSMVARFPTLARCNAVVESTESGTGPAGADVGSRAPRHWRHAARTLGGNQQAALARITPASRFEHGPLGARRPSAFEAGLEKNMLDAQDGVRFRAAPSARRRRDVVTFRWEMLLAGSETVLASGLEFLIVDDGGRILVDHPFIPA